MAGNDRGLLRRRPGTAALPDGDRLLLAALSVAAMALAVVGTWQGPGLTDDSVNYLSSGINVANGRGWVMLADQPLTIFPPGMAGIVAVGEALGLGAEPTLRVLSIASFGAIVVLGHHLVRRVTARRSVVIGATVLLAVSPALFGVAKMAWSEPPFIVLTLLFLLALARVLERRSLTYGDAAGLAALASLAFLVRYIGLSLLALGGIALLVAIRPLDRRALSRIAVFGLLGAVVPVACVVRNHAADGTYLGKRIPSPDSLTDSGYRILRTLGEWVYPISGTAGLTLSLIGAATIILVVAGVIAAIGRRRDRDDKGGDDERGRIHLLCCVGFVVIYSAYLVAASLGTAFEPINSRYLSPVYVPLVAIAAAGLAWVLQTIPSLNGRRAIGALLALLIAGHLVASVDDAWTGAVDGIGYNADGYVDSDLAAQALRLAEEEQDAVVLSNLPFGLWAATRLQPVRWAPLAIGFRGAPIEGELEELVRQVACAPGRTFLVRYHFGHPRALGLDGIRTAVNVERVRVADDGAIFELTTNGPVACTDASLRPTRPR